MKTRKQDELSVALKDVAATEKLGSLLAEHLQDGLLVFLQGELGAGKTSLVRGMLRRLDFTGAVKSPTYTLLEEYFLGDREIIHFDLYRLTDPEELDLIGVRDYFSSSACCFIEWPERGEGYLPREDVQILITHEGDGRTARIIACSSRGTEVLQAIRPELDPVSG